MDKKLNTKGHIEDTQKKQINQGIVISASDLHLSGGPDGI